MFPFFHLYSQSRPLLKDQKKFLDLVDPLLQGRYPRRCLNYAVAVTAMCLNEEANFRPLIHDIVVALDYLESQSQIHPVSRNGGARGAAPYSASEVSQGTHSRSSSSA